MARPRRELAIAERAQLAAEDLLGDRDAVLVKDPLREVDQAPADDAIDGRNRSGLDLGDERSPMLLTWRMADDPHFLQAYRLDARKDHKKRSDTILAHEWYVGESAKDHDNPYRHAALVMSAVGCDWRDRDNIFNFGRA